MGIGYDPEGEFHESLGEALSRWQWVEQEAYMLFAHFLHGTDHKVVSVIFHLIQSFETRLQLLDRCAYFLVTDKRAAKKWKDLKKRLVDQGKIRNQIVHFSHVISHKDRKTQHQIQPSFMDATYAMHDKWKNPKYYFDRDRLREVAEVFRALADDLRSFKESIAK